MANIRFCGSLETETHEHDLECYLSHTGHIYIDIHMSDSEIEPSWICFDIPTAIAFRKHLAQQIAKAKEAENGRG